MFEYTGTHYVHTVRERARGDEPPTPRSNRPAVIFRKMPPAPRNVSAQGRREKNQECGWNVVEWEEEEERQEEVGTGQGGCGGGGGGGRGGGRLRARPRLLPRRATTPPLNIPC